MDGWDGMEGRTVGRTDRQSVWLIRTKVCELLVCSLRFVDSTATVNLS